MAAEDLSQALELLKLHKPIDNKNELKSLAYLNNFLGVILLNGCNDCSKAAFNLKESYNY